MRHQFEALARGDFEAAAQLWQPDVTWRAVESAPDDVGEIRGREALRRYYGDWLETFDDMRAKVDEVLLEADDGCVLAIHNEGRPRGSEAIVRGRYFVACRLHGGRLASGREYATLEEALASEVISE
jgi:ketosteroid isomerase-like protein